MHREGQITHFKAPLVSDAGLSLDDRIYQWHANKVDRKNELR